MPTFFDPTNTATLYDNTAPMQFFVNAFESSVTLDLEADLYSQQTDPIIAHADAVLIVTKEQIREIFKFQSDALDVIDLSGSGLADADIKFYTSYGAFAAVVSDLNPANAVVTDDTAIVTSDVTGAYPANKKMVAHDFVRHMAKDMFTTPYAVDLFNNELALLNEIRNVCGAGPSPTAEKYVLESIGERILAVDISDGTLTEEDGSGNQYMPNEPVMDGSANVNLGHVLFSQMMADGARIQSWLDVSNEELDEATYPRDKALPMPFRDGDEIIFKVTLNPHPDQHKLVRENNAVADRSYRIIWRIGPIANKVEVAETEL